MNDAAEATPELTETPQEIETSQEAPQETTETPTEPAKVKFDDAQQEVFNNAILAKDRKHFGRMDEQKKRVQELEQQNADLQAKIPVAARPEVPPIPDQYAENFNELMQTRETALIAQGDFDRNERVASENNLQQQQQHQASQIQAIQTAKNTYDARADSLNIKAEEIAPAWQSLVNHGVNVQVQAHLLDEPTGPQMVDYLAKNPLEMAKFADMSAMQAAVFIATELKTSAAGASKKVELVPDPAETLRGNGAREGTRGPKGATFE